MRQEPSARTPFTASGHERDARRLRRSPGLEGGPGCHGPFRHGAVSLSAGRPVHGQSHGDDLPAALRRRFTGQLLPSGDLGYDDIRTVWNGVHDRHPALITRCLSAADVSAAVRYADTAGLPVTVRPTPPP